ncbi:Copia protein, partial [Mucuna pruriens]
MLFDPFEPWHMTYLNIRVPLNYCDSNSTINIAHNPIHHERTKHIEIDKHFIKDKLDCDLIVIVHIPIGLHVTNVFKKRLPSARFQDLIGKLGMIDINLST